MSNALGVIASIRKNDPSITSCFAYVESSDIVKQLAEALEGNIHLKELSLFIKLDLCYSERLESAVANAKLTHLSLHWVTAWNRFFPTGEEYNEHCLFEAVRRSPTIQHLVVCTHQWQSMDEVVRCLPHIQSLKLDGRIEDIYKFKVFCDGLESTLATLTSLHLRDTGFKSADDIRQLSQALASITSLTSLHLDDSWLMDNDYVKAFLEHWHHDSQIGTLAFNRCGISVEGAMLLIQAASSHPAMESLSIEGNKRIGYDGLANIAMELPNIVLKSLNVASCVNFEKIPNWRETAVVVGGLMAQGVNANTHLTDEIDVS